MNTCINTHVGPIKLEWYEELDDDRTRLLIIQRCQNCGVPAGAEDYATAEEQEAYDMGEQPMRVPQ
jgi:hypothetical protein